MRLYKNVDIIDVMSIRERGLLPASVCGNHNWGDHKRVNNSEDVVYMFIPYEAHRVFPNYGCALVVCEIPDDRVTEIQSVGGYAEHYREFIVDEVRPDEILDVYVPRILGTLEGCTPCEAEFEFWDEQPDDLERFVATAHVTKSSWVMYFRGERKNHVVIDVRKVRYMV